MGRSETYENNSTKAGRGEMEGSILLGSSLRQVSEVVTYSLKVDCYLKGCNTNPQDTTKITTE